MKNTKKILFLLVLLMSLLVGCEFLPTGDQPTNGDQASEDHVHTWVINESKCVEPTCTSEGKEVFDCSCGEEKTDIVSKISHTLAQTLNYDDESHWQECEACHEKFNTANHSFVLSEELSKDPTYEENGENISVCVCGKQIVETVDKLTFEGSAVITLSKELDLRSGEAIDINVVLEGALVDNDDVTITYNLSKESVAVVEDSKLNCLTAGTTSLTVTVNHPLLATPILKVFDLEISDDFEYQAILANEEIIGYQITRYNGNSVDVVIPSSYDGAPVIKLCDGLFLNNASIQTLTIADSVSEIGVEMARGAVSLTSVTFIESDEPLKIGARAFMECGVVELVVPSRCNWIGIGAFQNTPSLETLTLESRENDIVWEKEPAGLSWALAWSNCKTLIVGDGITELPDNFSFDSLIENVVFEDRTSSTTLSLGALAFRGTHIRNLLIPDYVNRIGIGCFQNTAQMVSIEFSERTEDIEWGRDGENKSWTFAWTSAKSVKLNGGISCIPGNFALDSMIESVDFGTSVKSIEPFAFRGTKIATLVIPKSVTFIGESSFNAINTLTTLSFEEGGTEQLKIGIFAFFQTQISYLKVVSRTRYIGWAAFAGISTLSVVEFEDGDTPLVLANDTFDVCPALTSVTLPNRLYAYNNNVFDAGCTVINGEGKGHDDLTLPIFDINYVIE